MLRRVWRFLLLLVGLLAVGGSTSPAIDAPAAPQSAYQSHYLVFGTQDASGTPRILAIDLNRTERGPNRVDYEYKLFVARGGDWSMPIYETWTADPDTTPRLPTRSGLAPTLTEDGHVRVEINLPDLSLTVVPQSPRFSFSTGDGNASRTGHTQFVVEWNGTTYEGPGVYEWIRSAPTTEPEDTEANAEAERRLDETASFGLYDWIVLYDDEGRLWHVSQGSLTNDFGYQTATEVLPAQTRDVLVRWLATAYDDKADQHSPTTWLVDVPDWGLRVRLEKQGEHRGHGQPRADGTRPIYVQASVTGRGIVRGEEHQFFGMVEHIRD
ncbi:MAG: hypothetical protein ABEL04_12940 [Salinibacter sp.]|uniref:hypothetical protein n=1 Tax=Salinibacter sp. TaxID=2065818 RepID=UPI0035D43290